MSETTAAWAASAFRCMLRNGVRFGLPISSSPSNRHFTLTGSVRRVRRQASMALTWANNCPLSSHAPRP